MSENADLKQRAKTTFQHVIDNIGGIESHSQNGFGLQMSEYGRKDEVQIKNIGSGIVDSKAFHLLENLLDDVGIAHTRNEHEGMSNIMCISLTQDGLEGGLNILNESIKKLDKPIIQTHDIMSAIESIPKEVIKPFSHNTERAVKHIDNNNIESKAIEVLQHILVNSDINVSSAANVPGLYISDDSNNGQALQVKCCSSGTANTKELQKIYKKELLPLKKLLKEAEIEYTTSPHLARDNTIGIPLDQDDLSEKLEVLKASVPELAASNQVTTKIETAVGGTDSNKLVQAPVPSKSY